MTRAFQAGVAPPRCVGLEDPRPAQDTAPEVEVDPAKRTSRRMTELAGGPMLVTNTQLDFTEHTANLRSGSRRPPRGIARGDTLKRVRLAKGERGQATVEFAFILPVVLLVIVGLIAFGKAFNYWLDMNHMANEAARWAVVNKVPPTNTTPQPKDVEQYLVNQVVDSSELKTLITNGYPNGTTNASNCVDPSPSQKWTFCFCYGTLGDGHTSPQIGDPVRVTVRVPKYNLSFFGGLPFNINLAGVSTQRLEQLPASSQMWTHCT